MVNVLADGSIWAQDQVELTSSEAIEDYVDQAKQRNDQSQIPTRLNLRADENVDTRVIKKVVQAAGKVGVVDVIFGTYVVER